jgi:hypothetical protein
LIGVNRKVGRGVLRLRNRCGQPRSHEYRKKSEADSQHRKPRKWWFKENGF